MRSEDSARISTAGWFFQKTSKPAETLSGSSHSGKNPSGKKTANVYHRAGPATECCASKEILLWLYCQMQM